MTIENQQVPGAASSVEGLNPPASAAPKLEYKDGSVLMDGKKMVRESDLLAAKQSLEKQLQSQQEAHTQAIDSTRLELSAEQKKVATLSANLKEAQVAPGQGATSDAEIARIKQELADALTKVGSLTAEAGKTLELRRQLLITQYPGVTAESLATKTMKELDSYEEALKAVSSSRGGGVGNYAVGAGLGQAHSMTNEERARKVLDATPVRGVRNAPA